MDDTMEQTGEAEAGGSTQAAILTEPWLVVVNENPGVTWIVLPQAGNFNVFYEVGEAPSASVGVFHQGGTTDTIQPGDNNIAVQAGDYLFYQLQTPATDSIKLEYQIS
jgi:hypothetical protein